MKIYDVIATDGLGYEEKRSLCDACIELYKDDGVKVEKLRDQSCGICNECGDWESG